MILTRRLGSNAGVTMVELLVGTALGLGAMATVLSFQRAQFSAVRDQVKQLRMQDATRNVVDLFAREMRRAGRDPKCKKIFPPIVVASATEVELRKDLNSNGTLEPDTEEVRYRIVDSTHFERVAGEAAEVLISDVDLTGSRFRYFDAVGTELIPEPELSEAQRATVRRVRLELSTTGRDYGSTRTAPLAAHAGTDVELRNRFFIHSEGCS